MFHNLANKLTLARILIIPAIVVLFYLPFSWSHIIAAYLFIAGCITDWLDGFIARKWKQTSDLGILLDPIADKLIIAVCLILLIDKYNHILIIIAAMIIISREIAVAGLREWLLKTQSAQKISLAVSFSGKLKTVLQMIAVAILLAAPYPYVPYQQWIGYIALCLAVALTIYSMLYYLKVALRADKAKLHAINPYAEDAN